MRSIIFVLILFFNLYNSQVGVNTTNPKATLDINGDLRVRLLTQGSESDSIVVVRDGYLKKISISSIIEKEVKCPDFMFDKSNSHYILFKSFSSIPNPNNSLLIDNKIFVSSGSWISNNIYYYSYSSTMGAINKNDFDVFFGAKKCEYKTN